MKIKLTESQVRNLQKVILNERILTAGEEDARIMANFVDFAKSYLNIDKPIKVHLFFVRPSHIKTTAQYNGPIDTIEVYAKDRAIIDVCRSIAHELVHYAQRLTGKLTGSPHDGDDGSPLEDEANAMAGEIIRKYGKLHPELYI